MKFLRHAASLSLFAVTLFALDGESHAGLGRRASPRAIEYVQSAKPTGSAVKLLPDKTANLYPISPQNAAVERMAGRLAGKNPLVVQGVDLVPAAHTASTSAAARVGALERFPIQGKLGYELEVAVVQRGGVELTPTVRKAVQEALERVSHDAANIRRVTVDPRVIEVETDAGLKAMVLRLDNPTRRDDPEPPAGLLARQGPGPT